MRYRALAVAVTLIVAGVAPVVAAPSPVRSHGGGHAYAGEHVSYNATESAVVNYRVGGSTMLESMRVQSASSAGIDLDVELSTVTSVAGARVTATTTAATSATVTFESGARMQAHDNGHGILVLQSGDSNQVVQADLSSGAEARQAGENRVVVTNDDGSKGTFIVVGEGDVAVNERGNVTARIEENGRLVYRAYPDERSSSDEDQERLIANGTAVAEVYVQEAGDAGDGGQQRAVDVVNYSEDTTVRVNERTEQSVTYTARRSEREGKVIITSVSEAYGSADDVNVTVDGEAAARAESYSEVVAATRGGEQSTYLVRQSSSAEATTDVVVGVDHFSTREVTVSGSGDGVGAPGFGVGAALVALAGAVLLARTRL